MPSISKDLAQRSDESLIESYRSSGDQELVGELYRRYHHLVYGTCLKVLKDPAESSDLVIHIFEKILVKLAQVEVHNFNSWLYSLSQNECVNYLRQQQRRRQHEQVHWETQQAQTPNEVYLTEEALLELEDHIAVVAEPEVNEEEEKEAEVKRALKKLPAEQRLCITLFFYQNKSYEQIAKKTSFSLAQVKSFLQNGKRNLKKLLAEEEEV